MITGNGINTVTVNGKVKHITELDDITLCLSSAGSSIIKSCTELRDDMISSHSQYVLYQIIPVIL